MKVRARRTVVLLVWWGVSVPLVPLGARAQHAEGIVRDVTGPPISHVYVALLDERQKVVAATLTEEDGSFIVAAPRPGNYYLRVARIGYVTLFDGSG